MEVHGGDSWDSPGSFRNRNLRISCGLSSYRFLTDYEIVGVPEREYSHGVINNSGASTETCLPIPQVVVQ